MALRYSFKLWASPSASSSAVSFARLSKGSSFSSLSSSGKLRPSEPLRTGAKSMRTSHPVWNDGSGIPSSNFSKLSPNPSSGVRGISSLKKNGAVISAFELYSIGIGPSSSHTVGPMRAARRFGKLLEDRGVLQKTARLQTDLYGSLAATGEGHGTPKAILMGLEGETPEGVDPDSINPRVATIRTTNKLRLMGHHEIDFQNDDLKLHKKTFLPYHPNAVEFTAYNKNKEVLCAEKYYSIGGGFVVDHSMTESDKSQSSSSSSEQEKTPPLIFNTANDLLKICLLYNMSISEVVLENEKTWRHEDEIKSGMLKIWDTMNACIKKGLVTPGILPGGLNVRRRAPNLYGKLRDRPMTAHPNDWVTAWAIAVNEENASGSRVVTAPTNGAAGIIPAVLKYYTRFTDHSTQEGIINYLLTAAAIGMLFKHGASISAAEVGCQGEVGVACSMAAAGLTAVHGGTPDQVETAAEIGMEHHLGLTCDPINGLVQIPCIERNVMGSINAIAASRLALMEDGKHVVSLDSVITTMAQTGREMHTKFKETSEGGLAVHAALPEC